MPCGYTKGNIPAFHSLHLPTGGLDGRGEGLRGGVRGAHRRDGAHVHLLRVVHRGGGARSHGRLGHLHILRHRHGVELIHPWGSRGWRRGG